MYSIGATFCIDIMIAGYEHQLFSSPQFGQPFSGLGNLCLQPDMNQITGQQNLIGVLCPDCFGQFVEHSG